MESFLSIPKPPKLPSSIFVCLDIEGQDMLSTMIGIWQYDLLWATYIFHS